MKVGDLIRRKGTKELALIVNIKESGPRNGTPMGGRPGIYRFPEFMWLDTWELDSCSPTLMEVVSEAG